MTEDILDALIDRMKTRLPAVLDIVWAERAAADGARGEEVPLTYPKDVLYGKPTEAPSDLPVICLWDETSKADTTGPIARAGTDTATAWGELTHTLVVIAVLEGDDDAVLDRQLARYRKALWRVITESQTIPTSDSTAIITATNAGRESRVAHIRVFTPSTRCVIWEVSVYDLESF